MTDAVVLDLVITGPTMVDGWMPKFLQIGFSRQSSREAFTGTQSVVEITFHHISLKAPWSNVKKITSPLYVFPKIVLTLLNLSM